LHASLSVLAGQALSLATQICNVPSCSHLWTAQCYLQVLTACSSLLQAGRREQGDLIAELEKVTAALQDTMTLARLLLRDQLRPVSSSASTMRPEEYRRAAIEYYYGSHTELSKIRCMVTGEEVDFNQITAGHIYRQGWPTGILVSTLASIFTRFATHHASCSTQI
jgi:hypothetical protein